MQEIPVLLVLMYQFHKSYITNEIAAFIPLIMEFLNLIPTENQKYIDLSQDFTLHDL